MCVGRLWQSTQSMRLLSALAISSGLGGLSFSSVLRDFAVLDRSLAPMEYSAASRRWRSTRSCWRCSCASECRRRTGPRLGSPPPTLMSMRICARRVVLVSAEVGEGLQLRAPELSSASDTVRRSAAPGEGWPPERESDGDRFRESCSTPAAMPDSFERTYQPAPGPTWQSTQATRACGEAE